MKIDIFDNKPSEDLESDWLKAFQTDSFDLNPIGFNKAEIIFHLRFISADELESVHKRLRELIDLPDEEQVKQIFEIYKEGLGRFSTKSPTLVFNGKSQETNGKSAVDIMNRLFPVYEPKAWKVIQKAWLNFLSKNEPDEVFK